MVTVAAHDLCYNDTYQTYGLAHLGEEQTMLLLDKEVRGATAPPRTSTSGTAIIFDLHGSRATGDQMVASAFAYSAGGSL